jgi:predicted RNase H-like nuclease (RuvC/YqgF family)
VTGSDEDQMQKEQEKKLVAIKERQKNTKEMTEKIEREKEELKRLTKELVEARKTQKKLYEEFAKLRQKDNSHVTTQAMAHSSAKQFTNPIEFSNETNNAMAIDPITALNSPGQAARMITVTR